MYNVQQPLLELLSLSVRNLQTQISEQRNAANLQMVISTKNYQRWIQEDDDAAATALRAFIIGSLVAILYAAP